MNIRRRSSFRREGSFRHSGIMKKLQSFRKEWGFRWSDAWFAPCSLEQISRIKQRGFRAELWFPLSHLQLAGLRCSERAPQRLKMKLAPEIAFATLEWPRARTSVLDENIFGPRETLNARVHNVTRCSGREALVPTQKIATSAFGSL